MLLKLVRTACGGSSTLGQLFVDEKFECFILEDEDRRLEEGVSEKVYGKTCIPRGKYKVVITWSNRFKRDLPLLVDVPNYSGVRIHPGNTVEDTDGCLLPGTSYSADSTGVCIVQNSKVAFNSLMLKLETVLKNEEVYIEIV